MTEKEKQILEDFKGFIDWSIEHDMDFGWIIAGLGHDINAILKGEVGVSPRTSNYARFQRERRDKN